MACNITAGRALANCKNVGGLKSILVMNYDSGMELNMTLDANDVVTNFGSANYQLYNFEVRGANTMDETNEQSVENGTTFWSAAGSLQLHVQDSVSRKTLEIMAKGRPHIFTLDWNGVYKLYGDINGCEVTVNTNSGAGMGDFNGYTVSIASTEDHLAYFVDSTIIDDSINTIVN